MRTVLAVAVACALVFALAPAAICAVAEDEAAPVEDEAVALETDESDLEDQTMALMELEEEALEAVEDEDEADEEEEEADEEEGEDEVEDEAEEEEALVEAAARGNEVWTVTARQLESCMPGLLLGKAASDLDFLNAAQREAQINTCIRKAAWLAQLGHESNSLKWFEELASGKAYEGRKDLGNTEPGDGEKFKGRGPIQLTGRANYVAAGKALGLDLVGNPAQVATPAVGFRTSAWFWTQHKLNTIADQCVADSKAFAKITKVINGGQKGAADRKSRFAACRKALGC